MWNLVFLVTGLIFIVLLLIVFSSKKVVSNIDNRIFAVLTWLNMIGYIIEITLQLCTRAYNGIGFLPYIFSKLYLMQMCIWFSIFSIYVFWICLKDKKKSAKHFNIIISIHLILSLLASTAVVMLKETIYYDKKIMYSFGDSVNFLKIYLVVLMICWITQLVINFKRVKEKKYYPVFLVIFMLGINAFLQTKSPDILVAMMVGTLICYTMYFTIENPDLKMVGELYKNKSIMEQTYVDKSNFLFEMTQEVRDPILSINEICKSSASLKNSKDLRLAIENIQKYSKQVDYFVNEVFDVNSIDAEHVKFLDNKYKPNLIFDEIISQVRGHINPDVKTTFTVPKDLPELYGDSIKLKQVVSALLLDSAKRTKSGFIEFKVNTIERFAALRLIIQIKDSSPGFSIEAINEILNTSAKFDGNDAKNIENNELDIKLCQKIVKLMGGTLLIKSAKDNSNEVVFSIDQEISNKKMITNSYKKYVASTKKIVVVNQDKKINDSIKKVLSSNNIESITYLNGINLLDDIESGKKFDCIIVGNDMSVINGYTLLQRLKEHVNFDIPVYIILENSSLASIFIKDGFTGTVIVDTIEKDINNIIDKI